MMFVEAGEDINKCEGFFLLGVLRFRRVCGYGYMMLAFPKGMQRLPLTGFMCSLRSLGQRRARLLAEWLASLGGKAAALGTHGGP